jgi:hypothetical protein
MKEGQMDEKPTPEERMDGGQMVEKPTPEEQMGVFSRYAMHEMS